MLTISYIAFVSSVIYLLYCLIKGRKVDLIGAFIILNVVTSLSIQHFAEGSVHPGYVRVPLSIVIVTYYIWHGLHLKRFSIIIIASTYFLLLSVLNTSDMVSSLRSASGLIVSLFMFPIAFKYINTNERFLRIVKHLTFSVALIILHYTWANIFQVGRSPYLPYFFYTGGPSIGPVTVLVFFVLLMPLAGLLRKKFEFKYIAFTTFSLVIILLLFRRGAVLGVALGFFSYMIFTIKSKKTYVLASVAGVLLMVVFGFWGEKIMQVYQARDHEAYLEGTAGRVIEVEWAFESLSEKHHVRYLTGVETFNSGAYFSRERGIQRSLHSDYMVLFHGTGIIGVILMFMVYAMFFSSFRKTNIYITSTYYSILTASFVLSYSGLFLGITAYSLMMVVLGGLNRISYNPLLLFQNKPTSPKTI